MYSSVHMGGATASGGSVFYLGESMGLPYWLSLTLGLLIGFRSHTDLDRLGEASAYGDTDKPLWFQKSIWLDTIIMGGSIMLSSWYVFGWEYALIGFTGIIIDIIDKVRDKVFGLKQVFPSHRAGFKMLHSFSKEETLALNIGVTSVFILIAVYKLIIG